MTFQLNKGRLKPDKNQNIKNKNSDDPSTQNVV